MSTMVISELQVLRSSAGYYIGRTYEEDGIGGLPYDRQSGYYKTWQDANNHFNFLKLFGEE